MLFIRDRDETNKKASSRWDTPSPSNTGKANPRTYSSSRGKGHFRGGITLQHNRGRAGQQNAADDSDEEDGGRGRGRKRKKIRNFKKKGRKLVT